MYGNRLNLLFFFSAAFVISPLRAQEQGAGFRSFLSSLWPDAQQRGVSRATFDRALRGIVPDDAVLLPGHGPRTSVARERATNPYLQPSFLG